jgi:2-keto-4-pentenoate hydratase/2-oxohepta-3-ene-1,7-dioic acid hydratase in catechol pathway
MAREAIRLGTVDDGGAPRAVLAVETGLVFLDEAVPGAPADVRGLIAGWEVWGRAVEEAAQRAGTPRGDVRLLPPLMPHKVLCVGANYHDHNAEMAGPAGIPPAPVPFPFSFLKPHSTLVGNGATVAHPSYGRKLDWEVELAVVIGADGGIFGYTILNDLSLRDFIPFVHGLGLDAVVSKGFDGAAPIGPWVVHAADVADPQSLAIGLTVNGEVMQDSSTASMIFGVDELVAHYARVLTLEPGDVIATGTPAGVGAARTPPVWLQPGDEVVARIDGLGELSTTIAPAAAGEPLLTEIEVNA